MVSGDDMGCWSTASAWRGDVLLSARLRLRPLVVADVEAVTAALADWDVVRHTALIPYPYRREDAEAFIAAQPAARLARAGLVLGVERVLDGRLIGSIGLHCDPQGGGRAELGYWLARDVWGLGLATEAVRRLLRHAFADLGLEMVWASVHPDNPASARLLETLGFLLTGHEETDMPARGARVVMPRYALAADEWRRCHAMRPTLLVAAAALIDVDGRVLMATRPPGKSMAGLWEFPGGKVDAGETPEAALVRELGEELGIDVAESCLAPLAFASHDYDTFHLLMPLFAIRQWRGDPVAREGQGLKWVRPSRLSELPMPPADIPLVAILRDWM